jgi:broad specificity phosphatase PhoE
MTTIFLIRHGSTDLTGSTLIGRSPGIHLNEHGHRQAQCLCERFAKTSVAKIICSPLERTVETAQPLAVRLGVALETSSGLNEIDFGDWTGRSFADLESSDRWKQWNAFRSAGRAPNGESMTHAQTRVVAEIERLRREFADGTIVLVTHGDIIRSALLYYLGIPLDFIHRLDLSTASSSTLRLDDWAARVGNINVSCEGFIC